MMLRRMRPAGPRLLVLAGLAVACYLPGRPAFRPIDVDNDVAVQTWLEEGTPLALTHGYLDDAVAITVVIGERERATARIWISVDNASPHDVVLDFTATSLEGLPDQAWSLADSAYSVELDGWSADWRVAPGETGSFRASFRQIGGDEELPEAVIVTLRGFIGSLTLADAFEFVRIDWP